MTNPRNIYLFIVWQRGRRFEDRIRADLASRFRILKEYEISWPWWHSIHNFTFLYRHVAFFSWLRKCWTCGMGPFRMIMVEDASAPERGENPRIVEAKHLYRRWAGRRWRVHSSTTYGETRYQYWLLTGRRLEDFAAEAHDAAVERIRLVEPFEFNLGLLSDIGGGGAS